MDSAAVQRLLGRPDSVGADDDVRDPGAKLISWRYAGLTVLLGSYNALGGIWLTDSTVATARGLRVGDSETRVRELYGSPQSMFAGGWRYEPVRGFGDEVVLIDFENGRVRRIYVGHIYD